MLTINQGDIFQIGPHRLMCGDAGSSEDILALTQGKEPQLIHNDPPYGINAVMGSKVIWKKWGKTNLVNDHNADIANKSFTILNELFPNSKQVWWGANHYSEGLPNRECWIVWDKNNGASHQTDCELAWTNFPSVTRKYTKSSMDKNRIHPTQKPNSLLHFILDKWKLAPDLVMDTFGGSGMTMVACHQRKIPCVMMEIDPKFCEGILIRMAKEDGRLEISQNGNPILQEYRNKQTQLI
jgi:DNA modification methylase